MKLTIFGVGYVGLVTGACFAELGNEVVCYDVDERKIAGLAKGSPPFWETGLQEMLIRNIQAGRLRWTTNAEQATHFGEVIFIAVGTPSREGGNVDLGAVFAVAGAIGQSLDHDGTIIVNKSTVPVGTAGVVRRLIAEQCTRRGVAKTFAVVSNPEFLREGEALQDFLHPDRIVIGADEEWARKKMAALYRHFDDREGRVLFMDSASAEMSKYAANAMLASRISLMNELANLCERVGADIEEVRRVVGSDQRVGRSFLMAGIGYGGSCFPKDVQALIALGKHHGCDAMLIEAIEAVNTTQRNLFVEKILAALPQIAGQTVAVWGLAFKPNTDDMRSAPAVTILERLLGRGAKIVAYDPVASSRAREIFQERLTYADDMYECLHHAEALVIITDWPEFKEPDFLRMKNLLRRPLIIDGRNLYSPSMMRDTGFTYISIGRGVFDPGRIVKRKK